MPRPQKPFQPPSVPVHRFAVTLPGVDIRALKQDLARLNLLYRHHVAKRWRVRQSTAKKLFEERLWKVTGKLDIFPTEDGKAKLWELYRAGELTMKVGFTPVSMADASSEQNVDDLFIAGQ